MTNARSQRSSRHARRAPFSRRNFLRWGSAAAAAAALPSVLSLRGPRASAQPAADQKFLFVVTASGGGSIIDSFLPVAASEAGAAGERIIAYPDAAIAQPSGSNLRVVRNLNLGGLFANAYDPATLLSKYYRDMLVVTVENTSVNHVVAQKRAITGAGIDGGRTLMEAMAMQHGEGLLLPNACLSVGGYAEPGDAEVPYSARAEIVANPSLYALASHGYAGVGGAPSDTAMAQARAARERFDDASAFGQRYSQSALRARYLELRRDLLPRIEEADLIHKLLLLQNGDDVSLSDYGLERSVEQDAQLARLLEVFPDVTHDRLHAQAALGFLLARYGISSAVTLGPGFMPSFLEDGSIPDTPIAFDFSHTDHVTTQNTMWSRVCEVLDGLITLLEETPHGAGSMWDQSLIYVATDFGRSKDRPSNAQSFSSGHHLNNGNLFISPMLKGNRVYGGVDPTTALTYGFDPLTGTADRNALMREGHLYSLVCQAMGIEFAGRHDMSGLVR
ncbi:MAG: twin-arginine translocation signal domain-containing protein [Sandaracinaceae bacterium]